MITVVEYLVIAAVIGVIVFFLAALVFGRGERMAALPARTSPSELPATGIQGDHVREVRFGLALRGYRMSDVDWTLERLASEIDALRTQIADASGEAGSVGMAAEPSSDGNGRFRSAASEASAPVGFGPPHPALDQSRIAELDSSQWAAPVSGRGATGPGEMG